MNRSPRTSTNLDAMLGVVYSFCVVEFQRFALHLCLAVGDRRSRLCGKCRESVFLPLPRMDNARNAGEVSRQGLLEEYDN